MTSPRRRTPTAVGILLIAQMVTAIAGTTLIQSYVDGDSDRAGMTLGVALLALVGYACLGIGVPPSAPSYSPDRMQP